MHSTHSRATFTRFAPVLLAPVMLAPALFVAAAAHAQCVGPIVDPEQGYAFTPDGFVETVAGVLGWDPDGAGPSEPLTIFNGTFRRAATAIGNGMVAFDGDHWSGFGLPDSLTAAPTVRQTFVHEGELYAVSPMLDEAVGSNRVWRRWRWGGSQWVAAGPLVVNTADNVSNPARIVSFRGEILAIGLAQYNTGASPVPPRSLLARQNRSQDTLWEAAGPPVSQFNGTVRAVAVGEDETNLYIGGTLVGTGVGGPGGFISNIARWDGSQLHALGAGLNGQVTDIFIDDANVYVTGAFTQSGNTPMVGVAKWDGSTWQQVGDWSLTNTQSIAVHDGVVYVVSRQGTYDNVYRLEDGQWVVDARTDLAAPPSTSAAPSLVSLEVANGDLYMVGRFRGVNARAMHAAAVRLDEPVGPIGGVWKPVSGGFNRPISQVVHWHGRVLATGSFTRAGKDFALWIAEWDGQRWSQSDVPTPPGTLVVVHGDENGRDGLFSTGINPARVFEFDGSAWTQLGDALTAVGGTSATVGTLARFQGDLYAAIADPFASGAGIRLQRWNGTQWEGVGGVIARESGNPTIFDLAVVRDQLYLHVFADTLDGVGFTNGLLRWDGQQMHVVQHDAPSPLQILGGGERLEGIVAISDGGGTRIASAELDGTQWAPTGYLPEGANGLGRLSAVGADRYAVLVISPFPTARLAKLDRDARLWVPVSETITFPNGSLPEQTGAFLGTPLIEVVDSEIHIFGTFSRIGTQTAVNWARFTTNGVPLIVEEPGDVTASCGGPVLLRVGVANGYDDDGALQYQWHLNGEALSETQFIRGVNTDTLLIPALQQPFTGLYTVTVTGACGTATSREAFVTGDAPECQACALCAADFDLDGGVGGADVAMFFSAFEAGASCADVDRDGGVTGGDIAAFFAVYEVGGC